MATRLKSLGAQVDAMRRIWPGFKPTPGLGPWSIVWFGDLAGVERTFHVTIEYGLPALGHDEPQRLMPVVRVLRPRLVPNWTAQDEAPLPHVYFELDDLSNSPLCLFDPRKGEWHGGMLIAETTVPWARRWLYNYELWEGTGSWFGGGSHPSPVEAKHA